MSNILDAVRVCFGSVPCSCFMSFILKFGYGSVCVMLSLVLISPSYWFLCSMCHVPIGCYVHCVMSPIGLFLSSVSSVFVISSHVLAFSSFHVLMLLPAVGESSPFMPCQVCLLLSLCQVKSVFVGVSLDIWITLCK